MNVGEKRQSSPAKLSLLVCSMIITVITIQNGIHTVTYWVFLGNMAYASCSVSSCCCITVGLWHFHSSVTVTVA
jgi:hypothetical protein